MPSLGAWDDIEKDVGLVAPAESVLASPPAHALGAWMAPLCPSNHSLACLVCLPLLQVGESMHFLPDLGVYHAT